MNKLLNAIVDYFIKPCIVFESKPNFSDNTKSVYDEFVHRGYNRKYQLVWYISDDECASIKNDKIIRWNPKDRKNIKGKIRNYSYYFKTKCIICCNAFIGSSGSHQVTNGKGQLSFYLTHGTPIKRVKEYYTSPGGIDYMISAAPELNKLMSDEFSVPLKQVIPSGFPRNDVFSRPPKDLRSIFGSYEKIIIWYPTYRQNANRSIDLVGNSLPLIHNKKNAVQLNDIAKKNNVLIVVKPHFAQDVSLIKKQRLSNILLIDDGFFAEHDITSYEMLAGSDALITDYSSVYFDYTLRDKPIAVVWEDIEEYRKFPGFAIDLNDYLRGAEKTNTIEKLCAFIISTANNEDHLQLERREIRDRVNISTDGQNSKRAVDFIVGKANL